MLDLALNATPRVLVGLCWRAPEAYGLFMSQHDYFAPDPGRGEPKLSRRELLAAGVAGLSAAAVPASVAFGASEAAAALPTVRPISSQAAYSALGVVAHPQKVTTEYQYVSQWMAALAETGATYFRGRYDHELSATAKTTSAARSHNIKWGMTVCPTWTSLTRYSSLGSSTSPRMPPTVVIMSRASTSRTTFAQREQSPQTGPGAQSPNNASSGRRLRVTPGFPT